MRALATILLVLGAALPAAAQDVPLERLSRRDRAAVEQVVKDATVDASVPQQRVRCRGEVYRFLLNHLPLSSRWLRALNMGDYDIRALPQDAGFSIDDKAGAKARCNRALDDPDLLVVVAAGALDVPVLPTIKGTGVIVVRYVAVKSKTPELRAKADVAFRVESGLLHMLSRPFKRTLRRVLTDKLLELIKSATALAEAIQKDPTGTYQKLRKAKVSAADLKTYRERFLAL